MGIARHDSPADRATLILDSGAFYETAMTLGIELDREDDGRWLAEAPDLSGVKYDKTREGAVVQIQALALRIIADRLKHGEAEPALPDLSSSHRRAPSSGPETK